MERHPLWPYAIQLLGWIQLRQRLGLRRLSGAHVRRQRFAGRQWALRYVLLQHRLCWKRPRQLPSYRLHSGQLRNWNHLHHLPGGLLQLCVRSLHVRTVPEWELQLLCYQHHLYGMCSGKLQLLIE